jgi:hypothetical protein
MDCKSVQVKSSDAQAKSQSSSSSSNNAHQRLSDPRRFKPTKRVRKSTLELLARNLKDYIGKEILVVRKQKQEKTVKTYVYLVFKDETELDWIRNIVHQILPLTETAAKECNNDECTCKACDVVTGRRRIKRRGFGYLHESDLIQHKGLLEEQGYVCSVSTLPVVSKPISRRFICDVCDYPCQTRLGYVSHNSSKHDRNDAATTPATVRS